MRAARPGFEGYERLVAGQDGTRALRAPGRVAGGE